MSNNVDIEAIKREGIVVLGTFHAEMKPKKSGYNQFGGYYFYTDKDIRDEFYAVRQRLNLTDADYLSSMVPPTPELLDHKISKTMFFYKGVLVIETYDFSKIDYERNSKNDTNQRCGATSTYAAKYSLKLMFNIPSEELDPDRMEENTEINSKQNASPLINKIIQQAKKRNIPLKSILNGEKLSSFESASEELLQKIYFNIGGK